MTKKKTTTTTTTTTGSFLPVGTFCGLSRDEPEPRGAIKLMVTRAGNSLRSVCRESTTCPLLRSRMYTSVQPAVPRILSFSFSADLKIEAIEINLSLFLSLFTFDVVSVNKSRREETELEDRDGEDLEDLEGERGRSKADFVETLTRGNLA